MKKPTKRTPRTTTKAAKGKPATSSTPAMMLPQTAKVLIVYQNSIQAMALARRIVIEELQKRGKPTRDETLWIKGFYWHIYRLDEEDTANAEFHLYYDGPLDNEFPPFYLRVIVAITKDAAHPWRDSFDKVIDDEGNPIPEPKHVQSGAPDTLPRTVVDMPKGGRKKEEPIQGLINSAGFAQILGRSKSWLREKKRHDRNFPTPHQPGGKGNADWYLPSQVTAYEKHLTTTATNRDKPR